jgi:hypothetical protein
MGRKKLSRYALLIFVVLLAFPSCQRSSQPPASSFFEKLIVGGAVGGKIYLEVPLKPSFFANAKTPEELTNVWSDFFNKAILRTPDYGQILRDEGSISSDDVPYWGTYVVRKIDVNYVSSAADLQIGDILMIRTPYERASVKITSYEIHDSVSSIGYLLLAVAEPLNGFQPSDTKVLVADRNLPDCQPSCAGRKRIPDAKTSGLILKSLTKEAKNPENFPFAEDIIFEGHFTRRDSTQYVAYLRFGDYIDGSWLTVILDSDLKIVSVLGENEYAHIKPLAVGDINNDGLDEIWTDLQGYEGQSLGVWFWRGGVGKGAFRAIVTAYNGV